VSHRPLPADVHGFRAVVGRQLGLQFEDGKLELLADVLQQRCEKWGRGNCTEYLDRLACPGGWPQELSAIATEITVGETYFFRNPDHFQALAETALPERLRARRDTRRLRILSAGCASGEEPYSLAILLRENAMQLTGWKVEIVGIDLNRASLARAARGHYSPWSLRQTSPELQARYFRPDGRGFTLDDAIRRAVVLEERNLLDGDPAFWQAETFDVVFCRNVTIYFTPDAIRLVIARIAWTLAPGGFLFLGHAETLRGISQEFHLCHTHDTFYYQRRLASDVHAAALGSGAALASPLLGLAEAADGAGSWAESIEYAAERIATLARRPVHRPRRARDGVDPGAAPRANAAAPLARALELLREERFADAMEVLRALPAAFGTDADAQLLRAVLLTNSGELAEAENVCRRLLESDELNAGAHYLLALCREQAGDSRAAVDHNQAAAYLDPGFAMPHVHLALVARRAGDLETARRELEQAWVLLPREDSARILLFGGGFSRRALVELCRAELTACGGAS